MSKNIINEQQFLWDKKWSKVNKLIPETEYAKEVYLYLKDKKCRTLLDIGCGAGIDSVFFAQKGFEVTAVDFSTSALNLLKQRLRKESLDNIICSRQDIMDLNFKDGYFDVIYANLILHYFDEVTTTEIFENLYRILKKEGYLFVRCKSVDDFLYGRGQKVEENVFMKNGKVRHFFSLDYLKNKLSQFQILSADTERSEHLKMNKKKVVSSFVKAIAKK